MAEYKLVVLTRPSDLSREEEYNSWYDEQHIGDVLSIPGFVAAQRFRMKGEPVNTEDAWEYLAVYEIDHSDPVAAISDMLNRVGTDRMPMSDSLAENVYCVLYEPITSRKLAIEGQQKSS